ncbi:MAG: efflux RND transporter permease subunit [Firmicutes bacterium]|nr:efflux RND transporter permease subunit [Bacillota bacterium]
MFSKTSINRPVTTVMVVLIVLIAGIVSFTGLKMDIMPNINVPVAVVSTTYTGAGPEEVESLITEPIESAIATVPNIDYIQSVSSEGYSMVIASFEDGTDLDFAALDMREKVEMIQGALPEGAGTPSVLKIDMAMMSSIVVGVSSEKYDIQELSDFMDDEITPEFERIEGVASATAMGGIEREVEIVLNPERAKGYGVTESYLAQMLAAENLNFPSGTLTQGDSKLQLKTVGEFESVEDIRSLPILTPSGAYIRVSDVAEVKEQQKDIATYALIDDVPSVMIIMQKQSDSNVVEVSDRIEEVIAKLSAEHPELEISMLSDTSSYIKDSMMNVLTTALEATAMAVIILLIFLKDARASLIIGISIPTSVISTFIMMYLLDMTMNTISLGGLTIGIGMFVDNSIVVLENIYRHHSLGKDAKTAALDGSREVSMSITASTLTTIAVFVPLMFISGTVGEIFMDLSATVVFSLLASLVVSITFVPMACAVLLDHEAKKKKRAKAKGGFLDKWENGINSLSVKYKKMLAWCLDHRKKTVIVTIIIFIATLSITPLMGMEFIPGMDQGTITINVALPSGSVLDETSEVVEEVLEHAEAIPEADTIYALIGGDIMSAMMGGDSSAASVFVLLKDQSERTRSTDEITHELSEKLSKIAGAEIDCSSSSSAMGSFGSSGLSFDVYGEDNDELIKISEELVALISDVPGLLNVESSAEALVPEANIKVNRLKAGQYGITAASVSGAVRNAVTGTTATQYKVGGTEIDVVIRQDKDKIEFLNDLRNITISTATGASIPITEVAEIEVKDSAASISRYDQERYITVSGDVYGRDSNSVKEDVIAKMDGYVFPDGYRYEFTGSMEMMTETFSDLGVVLIIAIALVFMIMASQFESLKHPFVVMFSMPLAFTGGILGLAICGQPISATSFMGFIMLAGMVVNNAIVLIDYTNQLVAEGHEAKEALMLAGPTRLRPILMTTLTTVIGLIPMAIAPGEGMELQQPMGITVIFGLLISTLVTLVFVPVVYLWMDNRKKKREAKRAAKRIAKENAL